MAKIPVGRTNVVTANLLASGRAVFLSGSGGWTEEVSRAVVARDAHEAERLMALAAASAARNEVVDPYLAAMTAIESGGGPLTLRERIRAHGPTVATIAPDARRFST